MRLRPLQAVELVEGSAISALLGKRVSHPAKSADQTMLRKMMRRICSEHSALQKRPITVHPVCAARRQACLSDTLLQLYVSSIPKDPLRKTQFPHILRPFVSLVQCAHRLDRPWTNKTDLVLLFALVHDNPDVSSNVFRQFRRFAHFRDHFLRSLGHSSFRDVVSKNGG